MADSAISGRHRLYKRGTDTLLQWLQSKASSNYALPTEHWLQLAKDIAAVGAEVPGNILEIATEVIRGREAAAQWYRGQTTSSSEEATPDDDGHIYFINVLKQVHALLSALPRTSFTETAHVKALGSKSKPPSTKGQSYEPDSLVNLFDLLALEDPPEESATPRPAKVTSQKVQCPTSNVDKAQQDRTENSKDKTKRDATFAIWCLLEDLHAIRRFIRACWEDFAAGAKSLVVACSIADAGFRLMQRASEEFEATYGDLAFWFSMLRHLGLELHKNGGGYFVVPSTGSIQVEEVDLLCAAAGGALNTLCEGVIKWYTQGPASLDPLPRHYHPFGALLWNLLPDMVTVSRGLEMLKSSNEVPFARNLVDEFISGLADLMKTGRSQIWLVVACQTYMDIYDIVKGDMQRGFTALEDTSARIDVVRSDFEEYCKHDKKLRAMVPDIDARSGTATQLLRMLMACDSPPIASFSRDQTTSSLVQGGDNAWSRSLKALLVFPTTIMTHNMFSAQTKAQSVMNAGRLILAMAYLYKAGRHYHMLETWEDMDFLLASHVASRHSSNAKVPIVSKPNSRDGDRAFVVHYLRALGAPSQSTTSLKSIQQNAFQIVYSSPLLDAMVQMSQNCEVLGTLPNTFTDTGLNALHQGYGRESKGAGRRKRPDLTPVALLSSMETQLVRDEPALNFNHAGFYTLCHQLSKTLQDIMLEAEGISKYEDFYMTTLSILDMAALEMALYRPRTPQEIKTVLSRTAFGKIAERMKTVFKKQGNRFSKAAFEKSSNHIPKHLHPRFDVPEAYQATVEDALEEDEQDFVNVIPLNDLVVIEAVE